MKPVGALLGVFALVGLLSGSMTHAQAQEEMLARYLQVDLAAKKTEVMSDGLLLPPAEEKAFKPVYQQYQQDHAQLGKASQALNAQYKKEYATLTEAQAKELTAQTLDLHGQRLELLRKYATELQKILPSTKVAKFVQLELQMQRLIDLKLNLDLPPLR